MKSLLCIDPGASGGFVEAYPSNEIVVSPMLDDADMCDVLTAWRQRCALNEHAPVAYMELVGGFVGGNPAPGSAMFNFGDGYGYLRGLLAALRVELRLVRPQEWQAGIPGVRGQKDKAARKRALKEHAARLFPTAKVTLKTADALCILDWARRQEAAR